MIPDERIAEAAALVRAGELVCFPTETMYGLAADIRLPQALDRLIALKGRSERSPFGLIVNDVDEARALAGTWPEPAQTLVEQHWPGPLTLVVPARVGLPGCLVGEQGGVGIRQSSHPWAAALARHVGGPITATSANPSGEPAAMNIATAQGYFGGGVAMYLDAGEAAQATPSTVVAVAETGDLHVLRAGAIDIPPPRS